MAKMKVRHRGNTDP